MTGVVQYAGRTFEYDYAGPSDAEVEKRALELQKENRCSEKDAKGTAKSELTEKNRKAASQKALQLLAANLKDIESVRAEVGISQRLVTDPDKLKSKTNLRETTSRLDPIGQTEKSDLDPRVITDQEVEDSVLNLVSYLNHTLYEKRQARLEAIGKKGGSGASDADFRVDLEIPDPISEKSTATGNPIGPLYHELAIRFGGGGAEDQQYTQEMRYINRYGKAFLPASRVLTGYTFITRPHCNLAAENLANVREFAPLLYAPAASIGMAIRGYLDTQLYQDKMGSVLLDACPFYDPKNPFLVPVCNALRSITGWPDVQLGIETSEGGFFSEQQTSVIGYDRLAKGHEFSLTFRDYVGQPILALHEYWSGYMGRLGDGTMHQYPDDVEANLMGYTVSIYRFLMDPTNRYIVAFAKATGCYPKLAPSGAIFNVNENEAVVQAVNMLSVPYFAHHVSYNDPIVLNEFNTLVKRYAGENIANDNDNLVVADGIMNNHVRLIPWISQKKGMNELQWRLPKSDGSEANIIQSDYNYIKTTNAFSKLNNTATSPSNNA